MTASTPAQSTTGLIDLEDGVEGGVLPGVHSHHIRIAASGLGEGTREHLPVAWPASTPATTERRGQMLDPSGGVPAGGSGAPPPLVVAAQARPRVYAVIDNDP